MRNSPESAAPGGPRPEHWAMDGVFPGAFETWKGDPWKSRLAFIEAHGFHGTSVGRKDFQDPERAAFLRRLHEEKGLRFAVHLRLDYREDPESGRNRLEEEARGLCQLHEATPLLADIGLVLGGEGHRFDREVPVEKQLDLLASQLTAAAAIATAADLPMVIENHADYYVSDLVALCERVPGLGIQLDTGNCFLVGERPDLIPERAFPFVQATHWKDHFVRPNARELRLELTGATLGRGYAGLQGIYEKLLRLHPDPSSIRMRMEWVPDPQRDPWDCFADSLAHFRGISGGRFTGRVNKKWNP